MKNSIFEKVKENEPDARAVRNQLHSQPELSGMEYKTSTLIKEKLAEAKIPYICVGNTSIMATIEGKKTGKCIALRADMDALPIQEALDWEIRSQNDGVMHACGHDCHTAMLLTAGKILWEERENLPGTVKLFFQEAEEKGAGAKYFVEGGCLEDVDHVMALHVDPGEPVGSYSLGYGYRTATGCNVNVTIKGKGGHSSQPSNTINPLIVAAEIINGVNQKMAYGISQFDTVVLTPTILAAGTKLNIIPETARITFNGRFYDEKYHEILKKLVEEAAGGIAAAFGASAEVEYIPFASGSVQNDDKSVDRCLEVIGELFGAAAAHLTPGGMYSEDFAAMTKKRPGLFAMVGAGREGAPYVPLHNEFTRIDGSVLPYGVSLLVGYTLKFLNETP